MLTLKIFGAKKKKKDITVQRWYCSGHIELNIKAPRGRCYGLDIVDCRCSCLYMKIFYSFMIYGDCFETYFKQKVLSTNKFKIPMHPLILTWDIYSAVTMSPFRSQFFWV